MHTKDLLAICYLLGACARATPITGAWKPSKDKLIFVRDLIEAGKVTSLIERVYLLSEVAEAHRYVEKGHARGKVIIKI